MKRWILAGIVVISTQAILHADKVITKDGKTYTGKIMIDTDKAVLIGNPPFDPNSYLIKSDDIDTIVYEQYHQEPPTKRRRGFAINARLLGNSHSSNEISLRPAAGLGLEAVFRFHPVVEIGTGLEWEPALRAGDGGLSISNGTSTRAYERFWQYSTQVLGRVYPFFKKAKWKTEPYLMLGYSWTHLIAKDSGDSLSGSGGSIGAGAIRPLTKHLFLEGQFLYRHLSYDTVQFLGQEGSLSPDVAQHTYALSMGLSYRF